MQEFTKSAGESHKIGNSLNILLIFEIIKFIKSVTIDDTVINFTDYNTYDKKNIVDNLPLKINNDVLEYIAKYKEYEQALFTFADGAKLSIDASFLSIE